MSKNGKMINRIIGTGVSRFIKLNSITSKVGVLVYD